MNRRSEVQRVSDMIDAAERATRHLGGLDLASLKADELRSDAIVRALEVVGEACKHVSEPVRERFPSVPWKLIAGMRDRLIHGYDEVDWAIVWETVTRFVPAALPELRNVRDDLLAEHRSATPETD
jgi:uncharacterized protein with HEPN domain